MARSSPSSNSGDLEKEIKAFSKLNLEVQKPRPVLLGLADQKSWSELPVELVTEILQRLQSYQDFVCATLSCSFWRLIGTKSNDIFCGGYQFPWLMLPEEGGGGCRNTNLRGFYNVLKNKTCYLELPEANGRKRCLSWHGWLVTVDPSLEINVVHPLSRVRIKLPDISTSLNLHRYGFDHVAGYYNVVEKAVFSSSPGKKSEDYTLSILFAGGRIGLWHKGDACWREMDEVGDGLSDIVFYKGRFYGICRLGFIYAWDTQGTRIQVVANLPVEYDPFIVKLYLVESGGSLLIISRQAGPEDLDDNVHRYHTHHVDVFEGSWCQSYATSWRQVSDLEGKALFLGFNSSFSIDAYHFPGCKPNCIYFTDDFDESYIDVALGGGKDMGIYRLEDRLGPGEPFSVRSFSYISPPLWVELTV